LLASMAISLFLTISYQAKIVKPIINDKKISNIFNNLCTNLMQKIISVNKSTKKWL